MKILAFSDTHGFLYPENKDYPKCDALCVCGDILPLSLQGDLYKGADWVEESFIPNMEMLLDNTGAKVCLIVAGNHDFVLQNMKINWTDRVFVLEDSEYVINVDNKDYKFYGSPWMGLPGWAYYLPKDDLARKMDSIPADADVVMVHCPPSYTPVSQQVIKDWLDETIYNLKDFGNRPLYHRVFDSDWMTVSLVLCGHIHEQVLDDIVFNGVRVCNVSVKDENYNIYKEPKLITILN